MGMRRRERDTGRPIGTARTIGASAAVTLWVATVAGLGALVGGAVGGVRAAGPARTDDAVALAAAAAGLVVAWWLAVAVLASAAAALLTGRGGPAARAVSAVARRAAPAAVRRTVAITLGRGSSEPAVVGPAAAGGDSDGGGVRADGDTTLPGPRPRARHSARPEVVVHRGDTLWTIAARHLGPSATPARVAAEWPRWYSANADVIGPDPEALRPGQRLRPPGAATARDRVRPPALPTSPSGGGPTLRNPR